MPALRATTNLAGHPQTTQSSTPKRRLAAKELRIRGKAVKGIAMAEYETKEIREEVLDDETRKWC